MKNKILGWLFKDYVSKLKKQSDDTFQLKMEAFKATLDIKDLIRERMKSVRPGHPDSDTVLNDHLAGLDEVSKLSFLSKAVDITKNETFKVVVLSLLVQLLQKASLYSNDMVEVNFNRATINGVQMLEEELEALTSAYYKELEDTKKISEEDRLSAL